jgi:hypothetical protein
MDVKNVLGAQAIRFVVAPEVPERDRIPLYPLVRKLQDRYCFLQIPNQMEEYDFTKGVTFAGGMFESKLIDKLQIFNRGLLCASKTDTDHCDRFIDDVIKFGVEQGLPISKQEGPDRAYFSSLEVHMDGELGDKIANVSSLNKLMLSKFHSYGLKTQNFPLFGFKLKIDATSESVPQPSEFALERREGQPFSSSLFACWGPLRTSDHLEILAAIEKMMTS